jgi:chitin synthase
MLQYVLCSPIWINVLNIYAFSNLHDFSWGTKEEGAEEDLGNAAGNKDGTVEVELPSDQADIGKLHFPYYDGSDFRLTFNNRRRIR